MHMLIKYLCVAVCLVFFTLPAAATDQCYRADEAEAEQGIRIHSELMVIGLNCQHMGMRAGHNLYGQYRQFTADHADLFAAYEGTLMAYFKQAGAASPEQSLNALRTKYANKISQDVAAMRPDVFCARYAPRVVKAAELTQQDLKDWASTFYDDYPVSKPFCSDEVAMAGN